MTFAVGEEFDRLLDISLPLMSRYAEKHGYLTILPYVGDSDLPASWRKVGALIEKLQEFEAVLWMDADIVISDGSRDIAALVPDDKWLALVEHHTQDGDVPNWGMVYLKREALPLLEAMWAQRYEHAHAAWWEQTVALLLMGYDSLKRPCKLVEPTEWYRRTHFLSNEWNSHPWDSAQRPRFNHATMHPDRLVKMQEWAKAASW